MRSEMFVALILAVVLAIPSPLESVKNTVEELKKAVGDRARIRTLILERMDFDEMGKRSLGRHWRNYSDAQRNEYLEVFERYVEVFYRKRVFESIEFIGSVGIKYKERLDGDFAEVDVEVMAPNGEKWRFTLRLHMKNGGWKAYDVVVEGISQVSNLRAQFDRIIEKEKLDGLLKRLREKIQELDR